jgi:hypothetical protein
MNIFEKKEQRERLEKEIQQAKKSVSQQKRTDRELKKVQSGGRVSSFLKRQSENNSVLSATIDMATAPDALALGQAIIQYQGAINDSKKDFLQRDPIATPSIPFEGGGLPAGETFGDILYWDPLAGGDDEEEGGGDWVVLPAPEENEEEENELKALTFQNGEIEWNPIEATSSLVHPWKIYLRETDGGTEFKVELNSRLYSGLGSWNNISVDGLNSWSGVSGGYIILFGVVEDGVCTEASIEGPQTTLSDRIDFVDEEQNSFAVQLGFLYQSDDSWQVRQNAFHNFTLINTCVNGIPSIYPMPT